MVFTNPNPKLSEIRNKSQKLRAKARPKTINPVRVVCVCVCGRGGGWGKEEKRRDRLLLKLSLITVAIRLMFGILL